MPSKIAVVPPELLALVHGLLIDAGLTKTAKKLKSETDEIPSFSGENLLEIYMKHSASQPAGAKAKKETKMSEDKDCIGKKRKQAEESEDDDDEEEEASQKKSEKKVKKGKSSKKAKEEDSEDEDDDENEEKVKKDKKEKSSKKAKKEESQNEDEDGERTVKSKRDKSAKKAKKEEVEEEDNEETDGEKKESSSAKKGKKHATVQSSASSNTPFQRVKAEDVSYLKVKGGQTEEERLKNNTFESKNGDVYGARASSILAAVRGKDFRHEKTKKKRGTYRGGPIDMNSNSIKFDNSDDDE